MIMVRSWKLGRVWVMSSVGGLSFGKVVVRGKGTLLLRLLVLLLVPIRGKS